MTALQEVASAYLTELKHTAKGLETLEVSGGLSIASQCRLSYLHTKIKWVKQKITESNDE